MCANRIGRAFGEIYEAGCRFLLIVSPATADDQHLTDVGVLGEEDPLWIMRSNDGIDMEAISQEAAQSGVAR